MKHTPGPWTYDKDIFPFGAYGEPKPIRAIGEIIAKAYRIRDEEETISNAHLIAAAPDMLFALQMAESALRNNNNIHHALKRVVEAITKATG